MRFGPNLGRRLRISLRPPGPLEPLNFILDTYLRKEVRKGGLVDCEKLCKYIYWKFHLRDVIPKP